MKYLELESPVKRLHLGSCPVCDGKLKCVVAHMSAGTLDEAGTMDQILIDREEAMVYCERCSYTQKAIIMGTKIVPIDRIEDKIGWDKPYLEENVLVNCKPGENPFSGKA